MKKQCKLVLSDPRMNGESSPVVVSPIEDFFYLFNNVALGESVIKKNIFFNLQIIFLLSSRQLKI